MALEVADVDQSAQGLIEQESKDRRRRLFGFDKQALIQASSGLVIGFIALYSSYDHVQFFNSSIKINQQWGVWLIAASLALVFIDAQLAARSRLRTALEANRERNRTDQERNRTDQERYRADQERNRADQERNRTDQERNRAAQERNQAAEARECQAEATELQRQGIAVLRGAALLNARYQLDPSELNRSRLKAFLALLAP